MAKALIKLAYRHVINASSASDFEKKVFHTSYEEFLMKSQAYNIEGKFRSFDEMKRNDGRANSLHYKLSIAVTHYIDALGGKIPGLDDQAGKPVQFEVPDFKLIASNITDKSEHEVVINYITGGLTLLNTFGEYLVLAIGDHTKTTEPIDTFTIIMRPGLSIIQYQEVL
jgi:hypothetical protein